MKKLVIPVTDEFYYRARNVARHSKRKTGEVVKRLLGSASVERELLSMERKSLDVD